MRLSGKVAVITGAASGIGKASASLFAREGAKVVIADINDAGGAEIVAAITAEGGQAVFVHTDVTIASEVEHLVQVARDRFGKIDIFFNDAGGSLRGRTPLQAMDEYWWDRIYAVNVKSVFLTTKYVMPEMQKAGGGVIINMGSAYGLNPRANLAAYSSAKAAVIALTKALALDLAPYKIRVNCICPEVTMTPPVMTKLNEQQIQEIARTIRLGQHLIDPKDVACAALYLASDESAMVTGTHILIDGGRSLG